MDAAFLIITKLPRTVCLDTEVYHRLHSRNPYTEQGGQADSLTRLGISHPKRPPGLTDLVIRK